MVFNHENLNVYQRMLPFKGVYAEKEEISQILRMRVGLRKSWSRAAQVVREDCAGYETEEEGVDKARDKARDKEHITWKSWKRPPSRIPQNDYLLVVSPAGLAWPVFRSEFIVSMLHSWRRGLRPGSGV